MSRGKLRQMGWRGYATYALLNFETPLISPVRLKLQASNFVRTPIWASCPPPKKNYCAIKIKRGTIVYVSGTHIQNLVT